MSRRRRARPKSRARLVGLVLGALVLIGTLLVSALLVVYPRRIREGRGRTFVVAIPENADARTVADLLHESEVVD